MSLGPFLRSEPVVADPIVERALAMGIDLDRVPAHVALIMDGNGRWARQQGKHRTFGHRAGVRVVRDLVKASRAIGMQVVTVYAFSTENWRRPCRGGWRSTLRRSPPDRADHPGRLQPAG